MVSDDGEKEEEKPRKTSGQLVSLQRFETGALPDTKCYHVGQLPYSVIPCNLVRKCTIFRGNCYFHPQVRNFGTYLLNFTASYPIRSSREARIVANDLWCAVACDFRPLGPVKPH
jgi:hypothetical protein